LYTKHGGKENFYQLTPQSRLLSSLAEQVVSHLNVNNQSRVTAAAAADSHMHREPEFKSNRKQS
jgi:hypothetical protein